MEQVPEESNAPGAAPEQKEAEVLQQQEFIEVNELSPSDIENTSVETLSESDRVYINVRDLTVRVNKNSKLTSKLFKKSHKKSEETANTPTTPEISVNSKDIERNAVSSRSSESREFILQNVSLDVSAGRLMAIIGGSGSGKTSLLNVMARRLAAKNLQVSGQVLFNGYGSIDHVKHAYVLQQDILQPNLTCRETLHYAAELRLPKILTKEQRKVKVEEVILELGLKECADTRVGDSDHKGLSGGEKRRLSIGIQLIGNPSVLFLDEPTTGLDANSAYLLVKTCHELAAGGRTLIMSVHQPRSDIFFLFDDITILTGGQAVYAGPARNVVGYFTNLGYNFPNHVNPADYLIDLSAIDPRSDEKEKLSKARVDGLVQSWKIHQYFGTPVFAQGSPDNSNVNKAKAPWLREIYALAKRSLVVTYRDPMGMLGLLIESVLMGLLVGLIFFKASDGGSQAGIRTVQGLLYITCSMQGYLILLFETYRLCRSDMQTFDREYNEGVVSISGFLISRRLAKCFTEDLFVPLIFSVLVYFLGGLRTDQGSKHFWIYFAVNLLSQYNAVTFATLAASLFRDFTNAALIGNLGFTLQSMACGYFVNAAHMPVYVRWTKYIAYVYYAFGALISNEFSGNDGQCPYSADDPQCVTFTGEYVIETLGFKQYWRTVPIFILLAFSVGFYLLAFVFLKYFKVSVSIAKSYKPSEKELKLENSAETSLNDALINIDLQDVKLSVRHRNFMGIKGRQIDILNGISANFVPGSINTILGPSGSGKSSLLSFIADRLNSSAYQKYTSSGAVLLNGVKPSKKIYRTLCSYVAQDDEGLLPALTVRETLYYAAYLRLPKTLTKGQKKARADEIILNMGLKYCADTLIGAEFVKGISGGEKRRVSISIQLLNDPKVLLLDEPTSGLDSFTAGSILEVLNALAAEGRTIICSIHQPRSDLFSHFGNVLLLAKGGRVAYNGTSINMLSYFAEMGKPCPSLTNPADHVLDLVSVNLQNDEKEAQSRLVVNQLLETWEKREKEQRDLEPTSSSQVTEFSGLAREPAGFMLAYPVLLRRFVVNFSRSPHLIVARIMQVVGIGIIFALYFAPLHNNYIGLTNRLGLVQEITALYFVGMLNNMAIYPKDRSVFYREYDDDAYGVLPFFLVYLTLEVPFEIFTCLIFAVFMVIIPGLPRNPQMYFACAYCAFGTVNCGESIGIIFNTFFLHEGFAVNIISVVLSVGAIMAGILSLHMPAFFKAINWLSPLKYCASILINLALEDQYFQCETDDLDANGQCPYEYGYMALNTYGLAANVVPLLGGMAVCIVVYRLIAFAVLKIDRLKLGVSSFRTRND